MNEMMNDRRNVQNYTAGIDIGTTTICGVCFDVQNNRPVKALTLPNLSALPADNEWEDLQECGVILDTVQSLLGRLQEEFPDISAVGVTGQMHGILYVDGGGEAVSPLMTWKDRRGGLEYRDGMSCAEYLTGCLGKTVSPGFGLSTHLYNTVYSLVPAEAVCFCTIGDYITMKLAGCTSPCIERSNAESLGIGTKLSARGVRYVTDGLAGAGIDPCYLPRLVSSGTMLGGSPAVCCASGDNQAGFLSSVSNPEGQVLVNIGTGSQVSVFSKTREIVPGMDTRPFYDRGFLLVGASLNGGKVYHLLKEFFCDVCLGFTGTIPENAYDIMETLAQQMSDGADKLSVQTTFFGKRDDTGKRGSIKGITAHNFMAGALVDAFLDGIAEELYEFYDMIPQSLRQGCRQIVFSGNGARRNELLCRKISIRFDLPFLAAPYQEEAALGAAVQAINQQSQ